MTPTHYLVTGGAGFIGSNIVERLLRDGQTVRVLDNLSTGRRSNLDEVLALRLPGSFEWMEGDIRSLETCRRSCRGIDYVIHQAALPSVQRSVENPIESNEINVGGLVNVLAAAREQGVRRVVAASSSSVYGDTPTQPKHEAMLPAPLSPYAASKLAGEHYAAVFSKTMGLPTVSLRYFNVFGPRQDPNSQYSAVVPLFIAALLGGLQPTIYGDGRQSRDFTYVDNVVQANLDACVRGDGDEGVINVACGEACSLLSLLDILGRILDVVPAPRFVDRRPGDVLHSLADIRRARQVLGYAPRVTLAEGLKRTVEHYRRSA